MVALSACSDGRARDVGWNGTPDPNRGCHLARSRAPKEAIGAGWPSIRLHLAGARRVGERYSGPMPDATTTRRLMGDSAAITPPPESIEQPALTIDEAANLMAVLGFVAFRTPPDEAVPDSCLMVMIRDAPTRRHFDPETASFWVLDNGRGRTTSRIAAPGPAFSALQLGPDPPGRPSRSAQQLRELRRMADRRACRERRVAPHLSFGCTDPPSSGTQPTARSSLRRSPGLLRPDRPSPMVSPTDERLIGSLPPDALRGIPPRRGGTGRALGTAAGSDARRRGCNPPRVELAKRHRPDALAAGQRSCLSCTSNRSSPPWSRRDKAGGLRATARRAHRDGRRQ